MKKRKSGNSFERFKKLCKKNGVVLSGLPSDKLIIVDENNMEYIVDEHFNLFNDYNTLQYTRK